MNHNFADSLWAMAAVGVYFLLGNTDETEHTFSSIFTPHRTSHSPYNSSLVYMCVEGPYTQGHSPSPHAHPNKERDTESDHHKLS